MRKIAFLCLALSACAHNPTPVATSAPSSVATEPVMVVRPSNLDKARYTAEATFNIAAQSLKASEDNGILTPAQDAKGKMIVRVMYHYLLLARKAFDVGDAPTLQNYLNLLVSSKAELIAVIPHK